MKAKRSSFRRPHHILARIICLFLAIIFWLYVMYVAAPPYDAEYKDIRVSVVESEFLNFTVREVAPIPVLDDHTRDIMKAYYNDDLSLAEIAEDEGISRQGIRHIVKKGEDQLLSLEAKLGIAEKHEETLMIGEELSRIIVRLEAVNSNEECVNALKEISKKLLKGN